MQITVIHEKFIVKNQRDEKFLHENSLPVQRIIITWRALEIDENIAYISTMVYMLAQYEVQII